MITKAKKLSYKNAIFCIYGIWSHSFNGNQFWGFKVELSEFFSDFLGGKGSREPHTSSKPFFSHLPRSPMSQLSYDTKMSKKYGSQYELLIRNQVNFLLKNLTNFLAFFVFARQLQRTRMYLQLVSMAKIGPQASKKVPQGQTLN